MALKYRSTNSFLRPDPKFDSLVAAKIINCIMKQGRKTTAQQNFYQCVERLQRRIKNMGPMEIVEQALNNVKPLVETKSRRVGGSNYQVPVQVGRARQQSLAIRWILESARARKGKPFGDRLADEIYDAFNGTGAAVTKKDNVHKMADANKAFAHLAW
ncbi:MAG: 30S ribosomal protein S7 [Planctomycetota bacterium]